MADSDEALERALKVLRTEYLEASPTRVAELWSALARVQNGDTAAVGALGTLAHRLAGSAGSYGFQEVSIAARELDQRCRAGVDAKGLAHLPGLVQAISDEFAKASAPE